FGLLSLAIAALGQYAVVAYAVAQRSHELGIRMALGARPRDVLVLILGRGLALVIAGVSAGTGLAVGLIPLLPLNTYAVKVRRAWPCWVPWRCWRRTFPRGGYCGWTRRLR